MWGRLWTDYQKWWLACYFYVAPVTPERGASATSRATPLPTTSPRGAATLPVLAGGWVWQGLLPQHGRGHPRSTDVRHGVGVMDDLYKLLIGCVIVVVADWLSIGIWLLNDGVDDLFDPVLGYQD
jgi:hypothetical protein